MKRRLAIWILRRFPVHERREILREGMQDLNYYKQREIVSYLVHKYFPNCHIHLNPVSRRKEAA